MKLTLSKKARWSLILGLPCALLFSLWIGTSDEVGRLVHIAKKGEYGSRIAALNELAAYGSSASGAFEDIAPLLKNSDGSIRRATAQALIYIDHRKAVSAFTEAMGSKDPGVRLDAREGLESIGSSRAQSVVSKISTHSESRRQRARINSSWFKKQKKKFERQDDRRYRQHRRIYGH